MSHERTSTAATLAFIAMAAAARAAEPPPPPRKPDRPVKLHVVYSRFQADKKIASMPYTLVANANGQEARLRMGIHVPLRYEGKEFPGNTVYKSVGNTMACRIEPREDGRFAADCEIEQSSLYAGEAERRSAGAPLEPPALRSFEFKSVLLLADGETQQYASATDPVTGEVLKIDMTLQVVK